MSAADHLYPRRRGATRRGWEIWCLPVERDPATIVRGHLVRALCAVSDTTVQVHGVVWCRVIGAAAASATLRHTRTLLHRAAGDLRRTLRTSLPGHMVPYV